MAEEEIKLKTAILIGAGEQSRKELMRSTQELERLADTANIKTVAVVYQSFKEKTKATFIGSGKVDEVSQLVKELKPDLVIVDDMLKAFQLRNLSEAFGVEVIDRYMLILDIFAARAKTAEGKLQVEIAQMKYNMSRISLIKENDERFRGGAGGKGPGESKVELEKRIFRNKLKQLESKVVELKKQREIMRQRRKQNKEKTVAIVGYTNAGKSTLLNALAKESIYADDKLFATLDTTTRKIYFDYKHYFLITDTVGFISKLPHDLVEAFQATLEEASTADCILIVVDSSDKFAFEQYGVTCSVLDSIGAGNIPKLVVLNKVDDSNFYYAGDKSEEQGENSDSESCGLEDEQMQDQSVEMLFEDIPHICISAKTGYNLEKLKTEISKVLYDDFVYVSYE